MKLVITNNEEDGGNGVLIRQMTSERTVTLQAGAKASFEVTKGSDITLEFEEVAPIKAAGNTEVVKNEEVKIETSGDPKPAETGAAGAEEVKANTDPVKDAGASDAAGEQNAQQ